MSSFIPCVDHWLPTQVNIGSSIPYHCAQSTAPINAFINPNSPPSTVSSEGILTIEPLPVDNVQVKNNKNPEARVKIILLNVENISKFIDQNTYDVYYYTRKVKKGKVTVCINYDLVLKKFPSVKLFVTIQDDKSGKKKSLEIFERNKEGNELKVLIETNKNSRKTVFLSFKDKIVEKFRISFKLKNSKELWRSKQNNNNNKSNGFEELLDILFRFELERIDEIMEKAKKKNIFNDEDIKYIENFIKNPKLDFRNFRSIIFSKAKNDKKKELEKLCFDSLYKLIISTIENDNGSLIKNIFCSDPKYFQFLKEYGKSYENYIIITAEEKKKRKQHQNTEESLDKKKQKLK